MLVTILSYMGISITLLDHCSTSHVNLTEIRNIVVLVPILQYNCKLRLIYVSSRCNQISRLRFESLPIFLTNLKKEMEQQITLHQIEF